MKLDFKLDFIYYQKKHILDGEDEHYVKLRPDSWKFDEYRKKASLEELLKLLVFCYRKEYANAIYWSTFFIGHSESEPKYPEDLNPDLDIYLEEDDIKISGFKKVSFKEYDDEDNNCFYTEWMKFEFANSQTVNTLSNAVKKGLDDVSYNEIQDLSSVTIEPIDSAISKIVVTPNTFRMDLNPNKWKVYAGF